MSVQSQNPGQSRSLILPVPYFVQPTPVTCQSTCLKMMASYLDKEVATKATGSISHNILDIYKKINEDPMRPIKGVKNSHTNMKWWLEQRFPSQKFKYMQLKKEDLATLAIVAFISSGFPVLVSVSHARVAGHIILVSGYVNYRPNMTSKDFHLVVHDPYGRFDPHLLSNLYGKSRFTGGYSLVSGGEEGPGKNTYLPITSASRQRLGDSQAGTYYLLGPVS